MRALFAVLALTLLAAGATGQAQAQARRTAAPQSQAPARPATRTPARPATRTPARPARPAAPVVQTVEATFECPSPLGVGVQTKRAYCDVLSGQDQADGIRIVLPPHTGPVTISFELHNRHLYSEELIRAGSGYRRYTATIGLLTADNTLLSRAVVQNEFRTAADLIERIGADAGSAVPNGLVKAVAPTGRETIRVEIPQDEQVVSVLGEKLSVVRPDGVDSFTAPGRPIAVISNVTLEFRPAPVRKPTPARRR